MSLEEENGAGPAFSTIRDLTPRDARRLGVFLAGLPEEERRFLWQDVADPVTAEQWAFAVGRTRRCAVDGHGIVVAFGALLGGTDWCSHVAEMILLVASRARGRGVGKAMAEDLLRIAAEQGYVKVTVHVVAHESGPIRMLTALGFHQEALLARHLRSTEDGRLHDLVLLANFPDAPPTGTSTSVG